MAPTNKKSQDHRPRPLQSSKSWSRIEPDSPSRSARNQHASTTQNGAVPELKEKENIDQTGTPEVNKMQPDVFEKGPDEDGQHEAVEGISGRLSVDCNDLPIELISLTDSFIESLSAKVHRTPPNVDTLSGLFQDFYAVATTHINTHISTLSSRQHRESSSNSVSSLASTASKFRAKAASFGNRERPKVATAEKQDTEQMMLTAEEISERKRARKALEQKRVILEEAVERRVCEGVYDRIWRHRSTQDEAQDEKLRSKTAALAVVGIGLTDLGVDVGQKDSENAEEKESEVREWLEDSRRHLTAMNDKQYPLGKLQHLKAAHKSIVDTLSHFHPSSSADEIMPMLIYTLITSRPEGINVMSNLYFIQRFRNESKVDGEAAYCLTNLEAAITFLETVDLASLREDEVPSGPPKPSTPGFDRPEPMTVPPSEPVAPAVSQANATSEISKAQPAPRQLQPNNRKLSNMFQPPPQVLGAAGAVRSTADHGFKSLGNSLGESYKFLLSKLKERQEDPSSPAADLVVPKTLDDARKLINPSPPEDDGSVSGGSSHNSPDPAQRHRSDSGAARGDLSIASALGGRKMVREGSADSARSAASSTKKVAFAEEGGDKAVAGAAAAAATVAAGTPTPLTPSSSGNPAIVESMRSLGSSLNPMSRIAGMGFPRGFGRAAAATPPPAKTAATTADGGVADLTTAFPDLAAELPPREVPKIAPPVKRFMELKNPGELRINEVLELLRDYRRLAGALKDAGAFEK